MDRCYDGTEMARGRLSEESGNSVSVPSTPVYRCYDCGAPLPVDARADACEPCIAAQREAEDNRKACEGRLLFDGCYCGSHVEVRS